jgi:hypothetical protein
MSRIRNHQPRPLVQAILRGVISGLTRAVLDWLMHHGGH